MSSGATTRNVATRLMVNPCMIPPLVLGASILPLVWIASARRMTHHVSPMRETSRRVIVVVMLIEVSFRLEVVTSDRRQSLVPDTSL